MGFFGALLAAGGTLALDVISALANGPAPVRAKDLDNKTITSNAYGSPWPRCRGTARLPGKVLWSTSIVASVRKTTHGGIFGIGQQSVYYNTYSVSLLVGFGKKLGGGAASAILRIWADGKLLFNGKPSTASISGTVVVTTIPPEQPDGIVNVKIDIPSGGHLTASAGDLVQFSGDHTAYELQSAVNAVGPTTIALSIWPPLQIGLVGAEFVALPGLTNPVFNLSSFDPDPHDGSHPDGGYPPTPGGVRFYLGSPTQGKDPTIVRWLGQDNVPGYRGLVGICIHDLQLANYGNRIPQLSAEISFDSVTGPAPQAGPIGAISVVTGGGRSQSCLPFSGVSAAPFLNPLAPFPYMWFFIDDGSGSAVAYIINTTTNSVVMSATLPTVSGIGDWVAVDADGYIFLVNGVSGTYTLYRFDGLTFALLGFYPLQAIFGATAYIAPFDSAQSLFGNTQHLKLIALVSSINGITFMDRLTMLPFGALAIGGTLVTVIVGYDKDGKPLIGLGNPFSIGVGTPHSAGFGGTLGESCCADANGDIWLLQANTLRHYDCQFNSGVIPSLTSSIFFIEALTPPSFNFTDTDVSSITTGAGTIMYVPEDDTILIIGTGGIIGKVSVKTGAIVASASPVPGLSSAGISPYVDILGSVIVQGGSATFYRVDAQSLTKIGTYPTTSYTPSTGWRLGGFVYDQVADSLWAVNAGSTSLYRLYLDRNNGVGLGRDQIISSLLLDAGYDPSQFDVSQVTTQGLTAYGVEFERESYVDSLKNIAQKLWLIDNCESDGKIVFVPRGNAPILTIPESELGALADPDKYEARVEEIIQDVLDTPLSVWIKYYDVLKQCQEATQYAKRISQAYPSALASAKALTNSRQQLDIVVAVTENATPMQQQASMILWDLWTGRFARKFKTGYKYLRLDPTDVVNLNYKGQSLPTRIEEADCGAGFALEFSGKSQDQSVYSSSLPFLLSSDVGQGSGSKSVHPPVTPNNYTLSPVNPLTNPTTTSIAMATTTASFTPSGLRTQYNARNFVIPNPGAGNTQIYYVTVEDPTFSGDAPGTTSLTAHIATTPAAANVGAPGFINMGAIIALGTGATPPTSTPGGGQPPTTAGATEEIAFVSTRGNFTIAHTLGSVPNDVQIQMTSDGDVQFQVQRYDAQNVYLVGSDDGLTGYLEIFA